MVFNFLKIIHLLFCILHIVSFILRYNVQLGFPSTSVVKNLPANAGDTGLIAGSGRSLWKRKWQTTQVFLPQKSHGQRSLADNSFRLNGRGRCARIRDVLMRFVEEEKTSSAQSLKKSFTCKRNSRGSVQMQESLVFESISSSLGERMPSRGHLAVNDWCIVDRV